MLHKWEAIMGLPEGSLEYQMEEHYHRGGWMPDTGETVLFKRIDSIDYAYDSPERMEVVAIVGNKVWLKNSLRDLVTNLGNISPLEKEKSLREKLVEIISRSGQQTYVDASHAADRLIEAGIKLEEET